VLILLSAVATLGGAQSSTENRGLAQETQVRGYWTDPATGLMWAGKDNGGDVSCHKAMKYCRDLRLAGYSDWRLANIGELQGIFDTSADAPGENPRSHWHGAESMTFHVKGNLFLTGNQWSSTRLYDDRGHLRGMRAASTSTKDGNSTATNSGSPPTSARCACVVPETRLCLKSRVIGMYGPPPCRKRKVK